MTDNMMELLSESERLLHAMQAGVGYTEKYHLSDDTTPKHLRVGINNALILQGALIGLLIEKGIFTEEEFYAHYNRKLQEEVTAYELSLSEHLKTRVVLA